MVSKTKNARSNTHGKYWVKIARPVFQTALFEVSAKTEEEAAAAALRKASALPAASWTGEFDADRYTYDIQGILPSEDREPAESPEEFLSCAMTEYFILRADTNSGEGSISPQPWLEHCSNLMVADLCGDWVGQLGELEEAGLEGFYNWIEEEVEKTEHSRPANVIHFMPHYMRRLQQNKRDK